MCVLVCVFMLPTVQCVHWDVFSAIIHTFSTVAFCLGVMCVCVCVRECLCLSDGSPFLSFPLLSSSLPQAAFLSVSWLPPIKRALLLPGNRCVTAMFVFRPIRESRQVGRKCVRACVHSLCCFPKLAADSVWQSQFVSVWIILLPLMKWTLLWIFPSLTLHFSLYVFSAFIINHKYSMSQRTPHHFARKLACILHCFEFRVCGGFMSSFPSQLAHGSARTSADCEHTSFSSGLAQLAQRHHTQSIINAITRCSIRTPSF